jgi:hypothetical protein
MNVTWLMPIGFAKNVDLLLKCQKSMNILQQTVARKNLELTGKDVNFVGLMSWVKMTSGLSMHLNVDHFLTARTLNKTTIQV